MTDDDSTQMLLLMAAVVFGKILSTMASAISSAAVINFNGTGAHIGWQGITALL